MPILKTISIMAVVFLCFSSSAQMATTSLHGTVFDENGAVVNGATVTLADPATGFSRATQTTQQG